MGDEYLDDKMKPSDAISQQGLNWFLQLPPQGVKCRVEQCEKVTKLSDIKIALIMFLKSMF